MESIIKDILFAYRFRIDLFNLQYLHKYVVHPDKRVSLFFKTQQLEEREVLFVLCPQCGKWSETADHIKYPLVCFGCFAAGF